ncbi:MAG: GNAT family N-acetyltransferase [Defluviitaleaceae bacterium]|nr:GNAT family N-acetyltransferase [Defluviitaleaceae bacterium]
MTYDISKYDKGKPADDISIITDYDQRYLGIIVKIFRKFMPITHWVNVDDMNDILKSGGHIAAFWHKMKLVGAVCWTWDAEKGEGEILHICFKWKHQRQGFGARLLDFVLFRIGEGGAKAGKLHADPGKDAAAAAFFKKYGFNMQRNENDEA